MRPTQRQTLQQMGYAGKFNLSESQASREIARLQQQAIARKRQRLQGAPSQAQKSELRHYGQQASSYGEARGKISSARQSSTSIPPTDVIQVFEIDQKRLLPSTPEQRQRLLDLGVQFCPDTAGLADDYIKLLEGVYGT
jgi:recombinational DNA repair ATPase RecF